MEGEGEAELDGAAVANESGSESRVSRSERAGSGSPNRVSRAELDPLSSSLPRASDPAALLVGNYRSRTRGGLSVTPSDRDTLTSKMLEEGRVYAATMAVDRTLSSLSPILRGMAAVGQRSPRFQTMGEGAPLAPLDLNDALPSAPNVARHADYAASLRTVEEMPSSGLGAETRLLATARSSAHTGDGSEFMASSGVVVAPGAPSQSVVAVTGVSQVFAGNPAFSSRVDGSEGRSASSTRAVVPLERSAPLHPRNSSVRSPTTETLTMTHLPPVHAPTVLNSLLLPEPSPPSGFLIGSLEPSSVAPSQSFAPSMAMFAAQSGGSALGRPAGARPSQAAAVAVDISMPGSPIADTATSLSAEVHSSLTVRGRDEGSSERRRGLLGSSEGGSGAENSAGMGAATPLGNDGMRRPSIASLTPSHVPRTPVATTRTTAGGERVLPASGDRGVGSGASAPPRGLRTVPSDISLGNGASEIASRRDGIATPSAAGPWTGSGLRGTVHPTVASLVSLASSGGGSGPVAPASGVSSSGGPVGSIVTADELSLFHGEETNINPFMRRPDYDNERSATRRRWAHVFPKAAQMMTSAALADSAATDEAGQRSSESGFSDWVFHAAPLLTHLLRSPWTVLSPGGRGVASSSGRGTVFDVSDGFAGGSAHTIGAPASFPSLAPSGRASSRVDLDRASASAWWDPANAFLQRLASLEEEPNLHGVVGQACVSTMGDASVAQWLGTLPPAWDSICEPAVLPLTTDFLPPLHLLRSYTRTTYTIVLATSSSRAERTTGEKIAARQRGFGKAVAGAAAAASGAAPGAGAALQSGTREDSSALVEDGRDGFSRAASSSRGRSSGPRVLDESVLRDLRVLGELIVQRLNQDFQIVPDAIDALFARANVPTQTSAATLPSSIPAGARPQPALTNAAGTPTHATTTAAGTHTRGAGLTSPPQLPSSTAPAGLASSSPPPPLPPSLPLPLPPPQALSQTHLHGAALGDASQASGAARAVPGTGASGPLALPTSSSEMATTEPDDADGFGFALGSRLVRRWIQQCWVLVNTNAQEHGGLMDLSSSSGGSAGSVTAVSSGAGPRAALKPSGGVTDVESIRRRLTQDTVAPEVLDSISFLAGAGIPLSLGAAVVRAIQRGESVSLFLSMVQRIHRIVYVPKAHSITVLQLVPQRGTDAPTGAAEIATPGTVVAAGTSGSIPRGGRDARLAASASTVTGSAHSVTTATGRSAGGVGASSVAPLSDRWRSYRYVCWSAAARQPLPSSRSFIAVPTTRAKASAGSNHGHSVAAHSAHSAHSTLHPGTKNSAGLPDTTAPQKMVSARVSSAGGPYASAAGAGSVAGAAGGGAGSGLGAAAGPASTGLAVARSSGPNEDINWNHLDGIVSGEHTSFLDSVRHRRMYLLLIPDESSSEPSTMVLRNVAISAPVPTGDDTGSASAGLPGSASSATVGPEPSQPLWAIGVVPTTRSSPEGFRADPTVRWWGSRGFPLPRRAFVGVAGLGMGPRPVGSFDSAGSGLASSRDPGHGRDWNVAEVTQNAASIQTINALGANLDGLVGAFARVMEPIAASLQRPAKPTLGDDQHFLVAATLPGRFGLPSERPHWMRVTPRSRQGICLPASSIGVLLRTASHPTLGAANTGSRETGPPRTVDSDLRRVVWLTSPTLPGVNGHPLSVTRALFTWLPTTHSTGLRAASLQEQGHTLTTQLDQSLFPGLGPWAAVGTPEATAGSEHLHTQRSMPLGPSGLHHSLASSPGQTHHARAVTMGGTPLAFSPHEVGPSSPSPASLQGIVSQRSRTLESGRGSEAEAAGRAAETPTTRATAATLTIRPPAHEADGIQTTTSGALSSVLGSGRESGRPSVTVGSASGSLAAANVNERLLGIRISLGAAVSGTASSEASSLAGSGLPAHSAGSALSSAGLSSGTVTAASGAAGGVASERAWWHSVLEETRDWMEIRCGRHFVASHGYPISFRWVVASPTHVRDFARSMQSRARREHFDLIQVPGYSRLSRLLRAWTPPACAIRVEHELGASRGRRSVTSRASASASRQLWLAEGHSHGIRAAIPASLTSIASPYPGSRSSILRQRTADDDWDEVVQRMGTHRNHREAGRSHTARPDSPALVTLVHSTAVKEQLPPFVEGVRLPLSASVLHLGSWTVVPPVVESLVGQLARSLAEDEDDVSERADEGGQSDSDESSTPTNPKRWTEERERRSGSRTATVHCPVVHTGPAMRLFEEALVVRFGFIADGMTLGRVGGNPAVAIQVHPRTEPVQRREEAHNDGTPAQNETGPVATASSAGPPSWVSDALVDSLRLPEPWISADEQTNVRRPGEPDVVQARGLRPGWVRQYVESSGGYASGVPSLALTRLCGRPLSAAETSTWEQVLQRSLAPAVPPVAPAIGFLRLDNDGAMWIPNRLPDVRNGSSERMQSLVRQQPTAEGGAPSASAALAAAADEAEAARLAALEEFCHAFSVAWEAVSETLWERFCATIDRSSGVQRNT